MKELNDDSLKKVEGGSVFAGVSNVQLQCQKCKKVFLKRQGFAFHFAEKTKHNIADVYEQKTSGKSSAGKKVGTVTASKSGVKVKLTYSNGVVKYVKVEGGGGDIDGLTEGGGGNID